MEDWINVKRIWLGIFSLFAVMIIVLVNWAWADGTTAASIKVYVRDEAYQENNIIKPRIYVENTGTSIVQSFDLYYYLKADSGKIPILENYYTPGCTISLMDQGNEYYCIQYRYSNLNLSPGAVYPDTNGNVVGVHYADWSPMNKTNDYSNPGNIGFVVTDRIPVITDGSAPPTLYYKMHQVQKLTLVKLECSDTEDTTGDDECYLEIWADTLPKSTISKDMGEGDIWNINKTDIIFEYLVKLRLMDEDTGFLGDDDDFLGEIQVAPVAGNYTGKFTQDGADYTLTYVVESITIPELTTIKKFSIIQLECFDTEDTTGDDECHLMVYGDDALFMDDLGEKSMGEGDVWPVNSVWYYFAKSASVSLIDIDPDPNDHLGTVNIDPTVGVHTGKFTGDGADYTMTYKVESEPIIPKVDPSRIILKVHIMDAGYNEQNIIKPVIYVENTETESANGFDCYYFFTVENGKTPVLEEYYTPDSTVSLMGLGSGNYAVKYHFDLVLDPGRTTNQSGEKVGIRYSDWSVMDKSNDASNPGGSTWIISDSVQATVNYPLPTQVSYKGANPDDSELGDVESELINGLAHNAMYWFWTHQFGVQRVPRSSGFTNCDKSAGIPFELAYKTFFIEPAYNHFGDCDFYDGKLYIPVTSEFGYPPIVLVYDENLNLVKWGKLGHGGGAWVALNPMDGKLYTSDSFQTLKIYDPATLSNYSGKLDDVNNIDLGYLGQMGTNFTHAPAKGDSWWGDAWIQGGAFSQTGVFYYVVDHKSDEDSDYTGVHAFNVSPLPKGAQPITGTQEKFWNPATEISLSGGFMNIKFDSWMGWPANCRGDELEGVDVVAGYDHDQVLVIKLSNELDDDDVFLYHFWVK
jgi:hypothetical protein